MNWFAMSQGREVFAIPGKVDSATSVGTNRLIKQGAKLIETVEDVLEELKTTLKECLTLEKENKATEPVTVKKEKEDLTWITQGFFSAIKSFPDPLPP